MSAEEPFAPEVVEEVPLRAVDLTIEEDGPNVLLVIETEDGAADFTVTLTGSKARETGDALFRAGCRAPG